MRVLALFLGNPEGEKLSNSVHEGWIQQFNPDEAIVSAPPIPNRPGLQTFRNALLNRSVPERIPHDIVVFENPRTLFCAPLVRRQAPDAKLFFIHATWLTQSDPRVLDIRGDSAVTTALDHAERLATAKILRYVIRNYLDGVISVSEMITEHVKSFADVPTATVRPTVSRSLDAQLSEITPDFDSNDAVFVGARRKSGHKGRDILLDAWSKVRERIPDASVTVLGQGNDEPCEVDGVVPLGYVEYERFLDELGCASLQIHPARFDASPVSILEGMRAGLPQIVTTTTGTMSEVEQISPDLVVEPTEDAVADAIVGTSRMSRNFQRQ
jgi:glycosyltransferase involved in cell wall biosynthesis